MSRLLLILVCLLLPAATSLAAGAAPFQGLKDVYFGEALYHAYQGDWFQSIARLDTELGQHHRIDEPALDSLYPHLNQAEFDVGDFELGYRMHLRAGRAITRVIEGKVEEPVRNDAIYRLARLYFQKDQPDDALQALERIKGEVPEKIRDDLGFLRAQILLATGRPAEASGILKGLQDAKGLEGFAGYNLGIALLRQEGKQKDGLQSLERTGQLASANPATLAIRDKANLVLGFQLLDEKAGANAKLVLDRVRLSGPFSNRALLAVPYAYGKSALLYGQALDSFGKEIDKLGASLTSVREGKFLQALAREELKQDSDWVVKLRNLPQAPETYYLLELMASNDFQESLKNYLDLDELRKKLAAWQGDLDAFEEIIQQRRAYYQPLLPEIDRAFTQLDSQIRLRLEQRERVEKRLHAMLVAPRPDYLATAQERVAGEKIASLEQSLAAGGGPATAAARNRMDRLRGVLAFNIATEYDQRLSDAYQDLHDLNGVVDRLKQQYTAFVRTRQAATQSFVGYDEGIGRQRASIASARDKVAALAPRQGQLLETMAVNELTKRRARLQQFQVTARFAIADSYDRANRAQAQKRVGE